MEYGEISKAYSLPKGCGEAITGFLNALEMENALPKTILYSLNTQDNELLCTILGCLQGAEGEGKIQHCSTWWFNDTKSGMETEFKFLANLSLLGNFVGMLTDSVASYPVKNNWGDAHHRISFLKGILAELDNNLPRIDCPSYMLSAVKKGNNEERYYLITNLASDVVKTVSINGQDIECGLSMFGTAVFVEDKEGISLIGKTKQGRYY